MEKSKRRMLICFLLPVVLIYLGIYLYPTVKTVLMSFYKIPAISSPSDQWVFVGLQNYMELTRNSLFIASFKNVFKITFLGGAMTFIPALLFAVILLKMKGVRFWRAIIYMPNVITPIALVALWTQYVFNNRFGFFKTFFEALGMEKLAAIPWTSDQYVFWAMLIAYCFGSVGYYMIMFMAAMQKVPKDFYECANLEGANSWQSFWKITMPLMKDVIKTSVIFWCMGSINFFLWSKVFTIGFNVNTLTPANYMYGIVFGADKQVANIADLNIGVGTAIGVVLCLSIISVFFIVNLLFGKERYEY